MSEVGSHRAFRAVLNALAFPGRPQPLPVEDAGSGLAVLIEAIWLDAPDQPLILDEANLAEAIANASRGTEVEPEAGATLLVLAGEDRPRTAVRLEGPGLERPVELELPLSGPEIAAREEACAAYPMGIDVLFLDGDHVVGLPRTTRVDVTARPPSGAFGATSPREGGRGG